jgi:Ca2+-binding RTX toxin-like protein
MSGLQDGFKWEGEIDPFLTNFAINQRSDTQRDPLTHVWARGDGTETVSFHPGGASTKVVLKGVQAAQVSFQRTAEGVTLVIAPSTTGGGDGGSLKLLGFDLGQGLESIMLDDAAWSPRDLAAKAVAAQATAGNDAIVGFGYDDAITGGAGDDRLAGHRGNDTYSWSRGDGNDTIDESGRAGGRADKLVLNAISAADVSFRISGQDVTLVIASSHPGAGDGGSVTLLAMDPFRQSGVESVQLADTTWTADQVRALALAAAATAGDDDISGFTGNDTLLGGAGNDTLTGRGGTDRFEGGTGNDRYVISGRHDTIVENAGEGTDTVFAATTFSLADNVENLVLTGTGKSHATGNGLDNVLVGNAAKNVLDGGAGNDTLDGGKGADRMKGGAGDDGYVVDTKHDKVVEAAGAGNDTVYAAISHHLAANVENLVLTGTAAINATGNELSNALVGNDAANILDGRGGDDDMAGSGGNDTYIVDSVHDLVEETADEGTDTVKASVSYALRVNVENLVLTGKAAINATGNASNNHLTGNTAANVLDGGAGNDTLTGGRGTDTFVFTDGFGHDVITDFHGGKARGDVIHLSLGEAFDTFAEVIAAAHVVDGNTVLDFGSQGTITLEGVKPDLLTSDHFVFG